MGFKAWYKAQNERHLNYVAEQSAARSAKASRAYLTARYGLSSVEDGWLAMPELSRSVAGATAEFELGADQKRTTLTRVAAGAIVAGPAGAIVGGLFRKNKSQAYVTVTFPDGDVAILDGPVKDEPQLREFARVVNAAGRHYAEADAS
jgi:hypothetical protein